MWPHLQLKLCCLKVKSKYSHYLWLYTNSNVMYLNFAISLYIVVFCHWWNQPFCTKCKPTRFFCDLKWSFPDNVSLFPQEPWVSCYGSSFNVNEKEFSVNNHKVAFVVIFCQKWQKYSSKFYISQLQKHNIQPYRSNWCSVFLHILSAVVIPQNCAM